MDYKENIFIEPKSQRLCLMCGKCCRISIIPLMYEQLKKSADLGDKRAIDFLDIFEPYQSIEEAKKIDEKTVNNILKSIKIKDATEKKNLTFYKCKYILDNNLCGIYDDRKDLCKKYPSSPWTIVPPGCGFEGFLFQQREYLKKLIRKEKERLLELNLLFKESLNSEQREKIKQIKEKIEQTINSYAQYGSQNW